jgi:hypothetical protein
MPSTLDALVARALTGAAAADTNDDWDAVWATLAPVRGLGSEAYLAGTALLDGSATEQQVGCMLLRVGFVADEEWQYRAVAAILAMAAREPDEVTLDFAAAALGDFGLPAGLPLLLKLSRHADEEIRFSAVTGIPSCCGPDYRDIPDAVDALIARMADDGDDVREWATFGVGSILADDSTELRDALAARVEDPVPDVRYEAVAGLARRRDPAAIAPTLAELAGEHVRRTVVEASEYLASEVLVSALLRLTDVWDQSEDDLNRAIAACDPAARARSVIEMGRLLDAVGAVGVDAALSVELLRTDTTLKVVSPRAGRCRPRRCGRPRGGGHRCRARLAATGQRSTLAPDGTRCDTSASPR